MLDDDDSRAVRPALGQFGDEDICLCAAGHFGLIVHHSRQQVRQDTVDPR